jgi:hypothetical protein
MNLPVSVGVLAVLAIVVAPWRALGQPACAPRLGPQFAIELAAFPSDVGAADLNGDGKLDLITTNGLADTVSVLMGNGNGTFQAKRDYSTDAAPISLALGDVNGDGRPDLLTANYSANTGRPNTVSVLLGNGNGTFREKVNYPTGASPSSVAVGDVNGDGKPDLFTANFDASSVSVLLGNGDGTFRTNVDYATNFSSSSVAVGDLNGDGRPDLLTAASFGASVSVLLGNGDGTFGAKVDYPTGASPRSVATGDVNGDGKLDVVTANKDDSSVSVLLGNGNGTFGANVDYGAGFTPNAAAVADVNGDGRPDVITANSLGSSVSVLAGNGDGTFQASVDYAAGSIPDSLPDTDSVAVGDANGDGRLDVIAANRLGRTLSVLLNQGAPEPVRITREPSDRTVNSGASAIFTVQASSPLPLRFQWRRNGVNLDESFTSSGVNSATLTLDSATLADSGATFDCVVSTPCERRVSLPATLTVVRDCSPPAPGRILRFVDGVARTGQRVGPGRQLLLRATATGPGLRYQWYRDGVPLRNGRGIFGTRSRALRIESVRPSDAGRYTLVIRNTCGPVTVGPANVVVR